MPYVLDRFEGNAAILEPLEGGALLALERAQLPQDAVEGDVLVCHEDGSWVKDPQHTKARKAAIQQRFFSLFKPNKDA